MITQERRAKLLETLELIGKAHDQIMEAQEIISDLQYEVDEDDDDENLIHCFSYILDDLEATLSEYDYIAYDNPIEQLIEEKLK